MINVVLIDDEPLACSILREYLLAFPNICVVSECHDGFEGVKAIQQYKPELIFLDIQMPKINGFEMLEILEQKPFVIFTTAFEKYALKAFETHAVDYLLKPFTEDRFKKALNKFFENNEAFKPDTLLKEGSAILSPDEQNRIVVKNGSKIVIIPITDIHYFEAYDDYVKIYSKDGFQLKKKTMAYFEKVLDAAKFLRVHRSYIIQLAMITRIEQYEKTSHIALLKNGAKIPLSKNGYMRLKEALGI